jgi:hypothetical protein
MWILSDAVLELKGFGNSPRGKLTVNLSPPGLADDSPIALNKGVISTKCFPQEIFDHNAAEDSDAVDASMAAVSILKNNLVAKNLKLLNPAEMNTSIRGRCLPLTCQEGLQFVTNWFTTTVADKNVLWLHGVAGTGKSTIATTIVDHFRETNHLGAFLFFDRNNSDPESVVRTLAYQLGRSDPQIRNAINMMIDINENVMDATIDRQVTGLLVQPLQAIRTFAKNGPIIIVIDGLDECVDSASRKVILKALNKGFCKFPSNFRVLVTSRNDPDINAIFRLQDNVFEHELNVSQPSNEKYICTFLRSEMATIREVKYRKIPREVLSLSKSRGISEGMQE